MGRWWSESRIGMYLFKGHYYPQWGIWRRGKEWCIGWMWSCGGVGEEKCGFERLVFFFFWGGGGTALSLRFYSHFPSFFLALFFTSPSTYPLYLRLHHPLPPTIGKEENLQIHSLLYLPHPIPLRPRAKLPKHNTPKTQFKFETKTKARKTELTPPGTMKRRTGEVLAICEHSKVNIVGVELPGGSKEKKEERKGKGKESKL